MKVLALWTDKEGIKLEKKLLPSSLMRGWSVRQKIGTVLGQEKTNQDLWNNWTIYFVLATEDILLRSNAILGALESYPESRVLELHASISGKMVADYSQPGPKPPEARLIWLKSQLFAIEDPVAALASALEKGMNNFYTHCKADFARTIAAIRGYELENLLRDAKESVARLVSHKESIMSVEVPGEPVLLAGKGKASSFYREVMLRSQEEQRHIENYHCSEFEIQYSSHLLLPFQMQQNDWVSLLLYVKNKMQ